MIDRIKVRIFAVILFLINGWAFGADQDQLFKADSLFAGQMYTQAFSIYNELFQAGQATSSMLLKMAFIQDASGNYSEALYFLDLYYRESADRDVVGKITELAQENELMGYRYSDIDFFQALLQKHSGKIFLALASFVVMLAVYILRKSKAGEKAYAAFAIQLFVAAVLLVVLNYNPNPKGIITSDQTLLRSGPSAGAEPIEMIEKGHKVTVVNQSEIWTKIIWDGEEAYVRNGKVKII